MSAQPSDIPQLRWRKPDQYHIVTTCGRYRVSRVTVLGVDVYVAWRGSFARDEIPAELGAKKLVAPFTDQSRQSAISAMQQLCEADAAA